LNDVLKVILVRKLVKSISKGIDLESLPLLLKNHLSVDGTTQDLLFLLAFPLGSKESVAENTILNVLVEK